MLWRYIDSWNTFVLSLACISLGTIFGLVADGFISQPGTLAAYLQQWQTIIGAMFALLGIFVAYLNVSRQISMQRQTASLTLMSREEDRMEKALPGLTQVEMFLFNFGIYFRMFKDGVADADSLVRSWETAYGFKKRVVGESNSNIEKRIEELLPLADPQTRQSIFLYMNSAFVTAEILASDSAFDRTFDVRAKLISQMETLEQLYKEAKRKRMIYEARIPSIRAHIEAYFAELDTRR